MTTTFENQCIILSDVWMEYRDSDDMAEFMDYFDLAFPMAFSFSQGIAKPTEIGQSIIDECWSSLLASLGVKEDTGFESLEDLIGLGIEPDEEQD
jgi:hypothetical protein